MGQPRQQAVLGILAMRANRVISRGELVDAVWGQDPPASAEGGIYTYVAGLRRVIEPTRSARGPGRVLVSSGAGYVLHLVPGQPDAVAFEQQLARARQLRKNGDQVAAVEVGLDPQSERRLIPDVLAQQVAAGDVRDAEPRGEPLGLRPLAGARGAD